MTAFVSDFLYSFRIFFKRPGLTLLAIIALAVSLGMSTTTFSTLNGMFFKPLPFENPEELYNVVLRNINSEMDGMPIPSDQFASLRELESFDDLMGFYSGTINISGNGRPERYDGAFVTPNFLSLLGHEPILGTSFTITEELMEPLPEILISHSVWMERFHGDPEILGTRLRANGAEHSIVGVLPEGFRFPSNADIWVPLNRSLYPSESKTSMPIVAVARIDSSVNQEALAEELAEHYRGWNISSMDNKEHSQLSVEPFGRLEMNSASQSALVVTIGAVIFILLVSCANVANLLVGRALTRGREMAIRSAIGATRGRIVRQLLTESLVLSLMGGIGGLLYAAWAVDATMDSSIWNLPYWMSFELDWRVFMFVFLIMLTTALISGLVPAWQASKTDLNEMLKDTAHTSTSFRLGRLTRLLAVIQIAFSCALLFGAGLVARNVYEMSHSDSGFPKDEIYTMRMGLFRGDYPEEQDRDAFYEKLIGEVSTIPGVRTGAVTSWIGQYGNYQEPFILSTEADKQSNFHYAYVESVSPEYFPTFDLTVQDGRSFNASDTSDSERVAVVNEAFVQAFYGKEDPVGKSIHMVKAKGSWEIDTDNSLLIVGVVPTVRVSNCTKMEKEEAIIYTHFAQTESAFMTLSVRTENGATEELRESIQETIFTLDPHLPVYFAKTMEEYVNDQIYPYRLLSRFFLSIGLMALFLAAIGIYGMLAFNVSRRRREIGIRMALGANSRKIVSQVLRQGILQMVLGVATGSGLAFVVGKLTKNFLLSTNPMDPSVYIGVLLTLIGVATLALSIPARRAVRLSPMEALRYE